jgi:hypothetical protein
MQTFTDTGNGSGMKILNFEWYLTFTLLHLKQKILDLVLLGISPQDNLTESQISIKYVQFVVKVVMFSLLFPSQ